MNLSILLFLLISCDYLTLWEFGKLEEGTASLNEYAYQEDAR